MSSEHWDSAAEYVELWWVNPDHAQDIEGAVAADGVVQLLTDLATEPFLSTPTVQERAKELLVKAGHA